MDSDASYGEAGEALSFGLGTPTGNSRTKKAWVVRRGLKRIREGTGAEKIRVTEPVVLDTVSRVSNAEFV
jgi:hypothetical protein